MEQRMEVKKLRIEAERQAKRQRMEQLLQRMQGLGERMGQPMPLMLFPTPPPPTTTPVGINVLVCMFKDSILSHTCKIMFCVQN